MQHSQNWTFQIILEHFGGKMGKSAEHPKFVVQNNLGPLCWEKIEKNVDELKLDILNDFEPLWQGKMGKVQNYPNWAFQIILDHFGG